MSERAAPNAPPHTSRSPKRRAGLWPAGLPAFGRWLARRSGDLPTVESHPLDAFAARGRVHSTACYVQAVCNLQQGADVYIGENSIVCGRIEFHRRGTFRMGDRSYVGHNTALHIAESIVIGDDVMISWGCTLIDTDMHSTQFRERSNDVLITGGRCGLSAKDKDWSVVPCAPITIGDKAWIGMHTVILKGVTIGERAVVGAGSVVSRDVPPRTVAAGNPARVVRPLCEEHCAEMAAAHGESPVDLSAEFR